MHDEPRSRWLTEAQGRAATYDERWAQMAAKGESIHGEADFVSSLGGRSVLDAGCGTGRVGVELVRRGFDVVGVDLDQSMLAQARAKAPDVTWVHGDLVDVDLGRRFDVVVAAGNVMIYLAPGTERAVVANLARHLTPGGALVAGFQLDELSGPASGAGRLDLATYDGYAEGVGLVLGERWATWDRQPFAGGGYAVSVHRSLAIEDR